MGQALVMRRSVVCARLFDMSLTYAALTGQPSYLYGGPHLGGDKVLYVFDGGVSFTSAAAALEYMARLVREAQEVAVERLETTKVKGRG